MIAICVCVTFLLLYAVQDVVATLFDERGRVSQPPAMLYRVAVRLI